MRRHNPRRRKAGCDPDSLEEVIESLQETSDRGAAIIVEGPRDRRSLRDLGIKGPIIMASQRSALELAESAAEEFDEIVVLTDWDRTGEELAQRMERHLRCTQSHANLEIRKRLKQLVRREIKDVESLSRFVERVRAEACPRSP